MKPYEVAFRYATAHGVLCAVHLPDSPDPVPEEVLADLHPEEAALAAELGGYRQSQFVGGRLAARNTVRQVGAPSLPILPDDRGAPIPPKGWTVSISHKSTLAICMIARAKDGILGVDIEDYTPERPRIARRVLRPAELSAIEGLEGSERWIAILQRFSLKECVYKALAPTLQRYIGYHEAEVTPHLNGTADIKLFLEPRGPNFTLSARHDFIHGRLLTSVRAKRR